jgi:hypothetical protein
MAMGTDFRNRLADGEERARTSFEWTTKTYPTFQDLLLALGFVLGNGDGHEYKGRGCAA